MKEEILSFVVDIEDNDFLRSRKFACIYCGDTTQRTRDHIISVAWRGYKRCYEVGDVVPSCRECNLLLGDIPLHCISSRADYISAKLEEKYRRFLKIPHWSEEELKEMTSQFQFSIKAAGDLKKYILARIHHSKLTALDINNVNYKKNEQKLEECEFYRILHRLWNGENYTDIEDQLEYERGRIKKIIKGKVYTSLIISFKYEKAIPFDYSLIRVFQDRRKRRKTQI